MYGSHHTDHTQDPRATEGTPEFREKYRPLPGNEPFHFPVHQASHQNFFHGAISAPAISNPSEDYFSWTTEPVLLLVENDDLIPDRMQKNENLQHNLAHILPQPARPSRRYSSNKIRHRSNLSHSYMDESSESVPGSLFARPEHLFGPQPDSYGVDESPKISKAPMPKGKPKPKPNKKPGFFLKLDDLNSPVHKVKHQHQAMTGPVSDPNHGTAYDKMEFFESDVYLQQSGTGGVTRKHENITPLMFPPNSEDLGYFGQLDQPDKSSNLEADPFPGGYLNVTSKIHDPIGHSGTSGNNSDIDSYLNFPVDAYTSVAAYEKSHYDNHVPDYAEEMENTKIEAHFTPISGFRHDHDFSQDYDENQLHHNTELQDYSHDPLLEHGHDNSDGHFTQQDHKFNNHSYGDHNQDYHQDYNYNHSHDHAPKHEHEHISQSYVGSHQGQANYQEDHLLQNKSIRHHQSEGVSFVKRPPQSSYDEYQYGEQNSYSEKTLSIPLESESLSDIQSASQAVESSDTDQVGSTEKKAMPKKRKGVKGIVCSVCGKLIVRDFSRHIRIHDEAGRFQCIFPQGYCKHKSRKFNRPYDYKKHLLNVHFKFDEASAKIAPNLTEKLHVWGQCNACGERFVANDWLEGHILTTDLTRKCYELQRIENLHKAEQERRESQREKFKLDDFA